VTAETGPAVHRIGDPLLPALVWQLPTPMLSIASAPLGGGIGERRWVLNAQVNADYERTDLETHLGQLASSVGCDGPGVGFLTAARVEEWTRGVDGETVVYATVGLRLPTWAAAPESDRDNADPGPGTVNVVAFVPARLSDAALVNAVITITEAKSQALLEHSVDGTGTASDAVCVLAPLNGPSEAFGGPRSAIGSSLARATHAAVAAGTP
jgi:adenosylcobinamide hydrolase